MGRDNHNYETTDDQSLDPFFLYIHIIITFIASHCSGPFDQICLRNFGTRLSLDHGWDVTGHLYLSSAPTLRRHRAGASAMCRNGYDRHDRHDRPGTTSRPRKTSPLASAMVFPCSWDGEGWWRMVKVSRYKPAMSFQFKIMCDIW